MNDDHFLRRAHPRRPGSPTVTRRPVREIGKTPVTTAQLDFCERRTRFLLSDIPNQPLTFLLANAYHQGLTDTVEMYEMRKIVPVSVHPLAEPWCEP